jgi:hypothetical protein
MVESEGKNFRSNVCIWFDTIFNELQIYFIRSLVTFGQACIKKPMKLACVEPDRDNRVTPVY